MATFNIAFMDTDGFEGGPVARVEGSTIETITTSGTSQQSTITASGNRVVRIAVSGGNVYIDIGANPTASSADILLVDGTVEYFSISTGSKVAVIDAA